MTHARRWLAVLTVAVLAGLMPPRAADGQQPPPDAEKSGLDELMAAYKLADFGRDHKAPEALIAAAGVLRKVHAATNGQMGQVAVKPVDDKDKPVAVEQEKLKSLADEANDLFDEASALGIQLKLPAVEALIKAARKREYELPGERGRAGGPSRVCRRIAPGGVHCYHIPYVAGTPAAIGIQSSNPVRARMVGPAGNVLFNQVVRVGNYTWIPPAGKGRVRTFTMRVENHGRSPAQYVLFTN
jgi:hypothetical protein